MMWPMLLDFSRDECKRILRKLELEAYAAIVSAFRAQGELTKDKKKLLQELSTVLSISLERHRAEIRRAVNDERLNTIADRIYGPNTSVDWAIEGRRLIPLLPRLVPQTAFTAVANSVASIQAAKNATMPLPSASGVKEGAIPTTSSAPPTPSRTPTPTQTCRVSLPSSIPLKTTSVNGNNSGNLTGGIITRLPQETNEENQSEDFNGKKRKRSASLDSASLPEKITISSNPLVSDENQAPEKPVTTTNNGMLCSSTPVTTQATITRTFATTPIRITLPSSQKQNAAVSSSAIPKQVVLQQLQTSNASTTANVFQRSVSIPVVKTVSATATTITQKQSKQTVSPSVQGTLLLTGKVSTTTTTGQSHPLNVPIATVGTIARTRPKTLPPPRQSIRPRSSVLSINQNRMQFVGQNFTSQLPTPVAKSSLQIGTPIQVKQVSSDGRTVQIRQEGGVKIVAQGLPVAASKILPKPSTSPIVMVSSTQGSNASKFSASSTVIQNQIGTKMVSIASPQNNQSSNKVTAIGNVSLVSRTSQAFSTRTGSAVVQSPGVKPNVIVVHKAQVWPQSQGQGTTIVVSGNPVPKLSTETVQETVTYIQKSEGGRTNSSPAVVSVSSCNPANISALNSTAITNFEQSEKNESSTVNQENKTTLNVNSKQADEKGEIDKKNNLLADVIEASGILSDGTESFPPSINAKSALSNQEEKISEELEEPTETVVIEKETEVLNVEETWTDESRLQEIAPLENDEKQNEEVLNVDTSLSLEDINLPLSQLEDGQILEIQTQDDAGVLSESTRITKEMLELLQQAGLHIQEIEVKSDLSNDSYQGSVPVKSTNEEEAVEMKNKESCELLKHEDNDSCEKLILCQQDEYESSEVDKTINESTQSKNIQSNF
ncbi:BRCA2-interacting transcriptional repressor EMSY-like isoform X1 [Centruroides sculpturatus]|uniref:BRCA2-interacting transcriptional repressor EMSY-like isoform X1 n=2 Tax=Centruroides sculpturatus TaxID=218467 RepID=UPI000C6DC26B|nr:BRCA2-interacting transcriptional repressor EMSY-like isoform X1 [Centruroides sculpturatus]